MKNNFQIFKFSNFAIATLLFAPFALFAQVDRTKAPKAGPAPVVKVGNPATFTLPNGLKVFVVQNSKLPRVSASLTLDIDPIIEGEKAGLSSLAGSLMGEGTKTKSKDVLDEEVDFLGADLNTSATSASINSLTNNFNKAFALMADVVLNPAFSADELEKIRKRTISGLETQKDEPSSITQRVTSRLLYGAKHPYGEFETEKSVAKINLADVKKYYNTYWKPNAAYLVFVGDITAAKAQALATQYFGKWQKGIVPKYTYEMPKPATKTFIAVVDRPSSVQSVITLTAPIQLKPGSSDAIPAKVMNNILGESATARLFMNLREKHGFTYGAYSHINTDKLVGSFSADASVRNEKTDSAIQEFITEFRRIKKEAVSAEEITTVKNYLNGSFARSLEHPGTIASFALNIARYNLPKDYYQNYLSNLAAVNVGMVQQMANKYITPNNLYIVIVGNAKEVAKGLDKYGEVKYFDMDGNETKPATSKAVDASVTGESIIKKYIAAIGGDAVIAAIKDVEIIGTTNVMGADMSLNQKYILPKNFSQTIAFNGMKVFTQSLKNGEYEMAVQGQKAPLDEATKEGIDEEAAFVNEIFYLNNNYTFTVKGIETVDGIEAYAVEVKSLKGNAKTIYYGVDNNLKIKTVEVEGEGKESMIVNTTYANYKEFNGLKIATNVKIDQGPVKSYSITDIKINTGLKMD